MKVPNPLQLSAVQGSDKAQRGSSQGQARLVPILEPIFSVAEVAKQFRCSAEKVKRALRRRDPHGLHGFKFGRSWFIPLSALERYIENGLDSAGHLRREEER